MNDRLRAIGVRLGGAVRVWDSHEADIERILLEAVGELPRDGRLALLLLSWINVHGAFVIVEKLRKLAKGKENAQPGSARWLAALASFAVAHGDHRWKTLARRAQEIEYLFPREVTESAVGMKSAVEWLRKVNFCVPNGSLRIRDEDVLKPGELVRRNRQYRNRCLYGPSWRADIVTALECGLRSPAAIARAIGCSYEPAYRVYRQIALVKELA